MQILSTAAGIMGVMDRPIKAYEVAAEKAIDTETPITLVEVANGEGAIIELGGMSAASTVRITIDGVLVYAGAVEKLLENTLPGTAYSKPVFSMQEMQRGRGSGPLFFKNSVKVECTHHVNLAACVVVVFA